MTAQPSTLKARATIPLLPGTPPTTPEAWQAVRIVLQNALSQIAGAAGATGVNVIPQQYALIGGASLPPIASTSNCSVSADASTALFGAASYKIAITGTPATVTFATDASWPLNPGWQWIVSFFQQASAAIAGKMTVTSSAGTAYNVDFTTTTGSAFTRLSQPINMGADSSAHFGLSVTFTGGTGDTVWLDGVMMEPYFGVAMQPSPFISTSPALTVDHLPDGSSYVRLAASHAAGNVAYNFKGVWVSTTSYVQGDEVVYSGSYWLALQSSLASTPTTSNPAWQAIGTYSGFQGAWSSATEYAKGAEVTYNGNFWIAVNGNLNSAPSVSNGNWQIAGPQSLDYIADGTTYQRTLASALTTGQVDLSKSGVISKTLAYVSDASGRFAVINGGSMNAVSSVDTNNRALIDFTQTGHIDKTLDYIGDGSTYARILGSQLSGGAHKLTISGSGMQLGDQRNGWPILYAGAQAVWENLSITYTSTSTSATISVSAAQLLGALQNGATISYNASSASVSGSAGTQATYQLYYIDPNLSGGTQTLYATTTGNDLRQQLGIVWIGTVTVSFPTSGTGGGGGGGGLCVANDMWVDSGMPAGLVSTGYPCDCVDWPSGQGKHVRKLLGVTRGVEECVHIETDGGAALVCSVSTPFDLVDGRHTFAPHMLEELVLTDKGLERVSKVEAVGPRAVSRLHLGGVSYAAGVDPAHRIYSHNIGTSKP